MLNCHDVTRRASDYLDGALPWRTRVEMRMHLWMCRFCRQYVQQLALVVRTLRRLPGRDVPNDALNKLMAAYRSERT